MTPRSLAAAGLLLGSLLAAGCALRLPPWQAPRLCPDQRPPQLILHAECRDGICGYTCAPDRWPPEPITARPIKK